jgi:hypothetical protein
MKSKFITGRFPAPFLSSTFVFPDFYFCFYSHVMFCFSVIVIVILIVIVIAIVGRGRLRTGFGRVWD